MTIPQWALLGFSAWTPGLLMATVGVYREVSGCRCQCSPVLHRHANPSSRTQWPNKNQFVA